MAETVYPANLEPALVDLLEAKTGITWSVVQASRIPAIGTGLVEQLADNEGGDWDKGIGVALTASAATRDGARQLGARIERVMLNLYAVGDVRIDEVRREFSGKVELIEGTTRYLVDSQWELTVRALDAAPDAP